MTASTTVSWRTRASSLVALLLTLGAASCASETGTDATTTRTASTASRPAPHTVEWPTRLQRERFALLRTRPEGLPARLRDLVRTRDATFNPELAQRIPALLPGGYWLVPDAGQICVVSVVPGTPGAGTVCGSTRQAIREGIATISFTPAERAPAGAPTRLVVGVAPEGTRDVLVHTHGSVTATPVVRGVFVLRDSVRVPSDFVELRRGQGG
ncbi:MAG TPA: hypothetical protein VKB25_08380 [Conexibacter sp.]|nr:hypothetical protein [Conexibacter sp.]